jgi:hypothetical protein
MYHTVRIRDLSPAPSRQTDHRREPSQVSSGHWLRTLDKDYQRSSKDRYKIQYSAENGPHTHADYSGHPLFEAFLAAYNSHEDIVLSPDDIWLMITIYYAKYVDDNAEVLRSLFVDHEGKRKLVVTMPTIAPE